MSAKPRYEHYLKNWSDIKEHLPRLFESAKGNCMEIGVRRGISTSALLAGIEEHGGKLWSVDIKPCEVFTGHPNWSFIQADSVKEAEKLKTEIPASLDLLFIDGDHTFEGTLSDLRNFGSRAKKILVHDTDSPEFAGVRRAVLVYCGETRRIGRFFSKSYGMAEIQ